jgi:hypothetical protein
VNESAQELDVTISTPGDWIVIEHGTLDDEAAVDALVGERLDAVPELAPHRAELVSTVAKTMARAQRDGVLFTAVLADPGVHGAPVMANLVVGTSEAPDAELVEAAVPARDGEPANLDEVEEALAATAPEEGVTQRAVHSILLPEGPALRVARLLDVPLVEGGPELTVLSVQYFFTASDLDQVFVLSFTSPSVAAHEELQLIFHRIARTFRVGPRA